MAGCDSPRLTPCTWCVSCSRGAHVPIYPCSIRSAATGTTLLTCAELGVDCSTLDVNPFLVWLARAKVAKYSDKSRHAAEALIAQMSRAALGRGKAPWLPALFQIEKWWAAPTLHALGRAFAVLSESDARAPAKDLAKLAFCRSLITSANVSFGHQSMSFGAAETGHAERATRLAGARPGLRAHRQSGADRAARKLANRAARRRAHGRRSPGKSALRQRWSPRRRTSIA